MTFDFRLGRSKMNPKDWEYYGKNVGHGKLEVGRLKIIKNHNTILMDVLLRCMIVKH